MGQEPEDEASLATGNSDEISELRSRLARLGANDIPCDAAVGVLRSALRGYLLSRPWPFKIEKLSEHVSVIVEMDRFGEEPHIYVVTSKSKAVVIDTGCNTANLRDFLWTLPELDGLLIQVVNTHVHYDHIMGNHSFCAS